MKIMGKFSKQRVLKAKQYPNETFATTLFVYNRVIIWLRNKEFGLPHLLPEQKESIEQKVQGNYFYSYYAIAIDFWRLLAGEFWIGFLHLCSYFKWRIFGRLCIFNWSNILFSFLVLIFSLMKQLYATAKYGKI